MMGYVFCAFLLVVAGVLTMDYCLGPEPTNTFEYIYGNMPIVYIIIIPILAMNTIAGEMRNKTDQMLYTSPVSITKIVMGKYLAMCTVLLIPLAITAIYPFILTTYGNIAIWTCLASMFSFFLLGCSLIAVCMFVSSLTENQLIAAILGIASSLGLYLLGSLVGMIPASAIASLIGFAVLAVILTAIVYLLMRNYVITSIVGCVTVIPLAVAYIINSEAFASLFPKTLEYLALFDRFYSFLGGIFDVGAIVYYISFAIFFIFLTVQSFDKRRWS